MSYLRLKSPHKNCKPTDFANHRFRSRPHWAVAILLTLFASSAIGQIIGPPIVVPPPVITPPIVVPPPVASISDNSDTFASERGDEAEIIVQLDRPSREDIAITFQILSSSTATFNVDYAGPKTVTSTVVIAAGTTSTGVSFKPRDDDIYEGTEQIDFELQGGSGYTVGAGSSGSISIFDDEPVPPPVVNIAASVPSAGEPNSNGEFAITTDKPWGDIVVKYRVRGTATSGEDFEALSGDVLVSEGEMRAVIPVRVIDDDIYEGDIPETVEVELVADKEFTLGRATRATVNIADNEAAPLPVASLRASGADAREPSKNSEFTVSLDNAANGDIDISYSVVAASTATPGDDYQTLSGTVRIPAGQKSAKIPVLVVDDSVYEGGDPETVIVELARGDGYILNSTERATVAIQDDDPLPAPVANLSVTDGDAGEPSNNGEFTVSIDSAAPGDINVTYVVLGASVATAGEDYQALSGTVRIPQGQRSAPIPVTVIDDNIYEGTGGESVIIELRGGRDYTLGDARRGTVNISDNDPPPPPVAQVRAADANAGEPNNDGSFEINLDKAATGDIVIQYTLLGESTANAGEDYEPLSGSVRILQGQSTARIPVRVIDDNVHEGGDAENVTIEVIAGDGYTIGNSRRATVTISDDDLAPLPVAQVRASDADAGEPGNDGTFTVTLDKPPSRATVIQYSVTAASTATPGTDYRPLSGTVRISPNQTSATITVAVIDDKVHEGTGTESVVVELSTGPGYDLGQATSATVNIADDDPLPLPIAELRASDANAGEPSNNGAFTITLDKAAIEDTVVRYAVLGSSTAIAGTDYQALSGSVTIAQGNTSATIAVNVIDDDIFEEGDAETVTVELKRGDTYDIGQSVLATVTIADNESPPLPVASFSIIDDSAAEPDDTARVRVNLDAPAGANGTNIKYAIGGTATNGTDYETLSGNLTISASETFGDIVISPIDNQTYDGPNPRTISLTLQSGAGYSLGNSIETIVEINDDEAAPLPLVSVNADRTQIGEGGPNAVLTFQLSRPSSEPVTLDYELDAASTAAPGSDFNFSSQRVTFPSGETEATLNLNVIDDDVVENTESIIFNLRPNSGYEVGNQGSVTVTITDNDTPTVTLVATDPQATEGQDSGEFTISLNPPAGPNGLTVRFEISGSASPGADDGDYNSLPQQITIPAGQASAKLIINPFNDAEGEGTETVIVKLLPGDGYQISAQQTEATVTIEDVILAAPLITVIAGDSNATESGSSGAFVIRSSEPAGDGGLTISFTMSGTAGATDYQTIAPTATIPAGSSQVVVIVNPIDDTEAESTESATLTLAAGDGYLVGAANAATLFIVDNDASDAAPGSAGAPLSTPRAISIQRIAGEAVQTARVNEPVSLAVRVTDETGNPSIGAILSWQIDAPGTAAGGTISGASLVSDTQGEGRATLTTGAFAAVYGITVSAVSGADTVSTTFLVNAGLVAIVNPDTPEGAVGLALDNLCPRFNNNSSGLDADQTALLARCGELYSALDANQDSAIITALREFAPEETVAQVRIIERFATQQIDNITTRLSVLRRGAERLSLSGFNLQFSEDTLPGNAFDSAINRRGGSAGGAIGDESAPLWKDERISAFVTGAVDLGDKSLTSQESSLGFDTRGVTIGVDRRQTDQFFVGTAFGFATSDVDLDGNNSRLDATGTTLSAYMTYAIDPQVFIDGIISYGRNDFDMQRGIRYSLGTTTVDTAAASAATGDTLALSVGIGYALETRNFWETELFGRLDTVRSRVNGYTESDAGPFNLSIDEQNVDGISVTFGGQISRAFSQTWGVLIPQGTLSRTRDQTDAHEVVGRFVVDTQTNEFRFKSGDPDSEYFNVGLGVTAIMHNGLSVFINYETIQGRDHYDEESWRFGLRYGLMF